MADKDGFFMLEQEAKNKKKSMMYQNNTVTSEQ